MNDFIPAARPIIGDKISLDPIGRVQFHTRVSTCAPSSNDYDYPTDSFIPEATGPLVGVGAVESS